MPGLKRVLEPSAGSEGEDYDSAGDRRSSTKDQRKRLRLSTEPDEYDSDDLTDEETQNFQATQFHQWQSEKPQQNNLPQENGIIECITCTNFMCHDYLQVDIGPLINFIIGHNGSGKSAVLTALTVCLGGKASATNRAASLKAFVKAGKDSCTVSVRIKNQGETAYQPELYGDTITVERSFSISGTSGFKLKSSSERVISTKRLDLEDITDFYALQLDNPMSVLTQDNARQFLNSSSPVDKYKFFMKGVQLEQLNQDYELLQENIQQIENTFEDKHVNIKQLEEKKSKAESNWRALERADNIRNEINLQRVKMAWSQVQDQENVLESFNKTLRNLDQQLGAVQDDVDKTSASFTQAEQDRSDAQRSLDEVASELSTEHDRKELVKQEMEAAKTEAVNARHEERQIAGKIKKASADISATQDDIESEVRRLEEINGGSHARLLAELQSKRVRAQEAHNRLDSHKRDLPSSKDMYTNAKQAMEKHEETCKAKAAELKSCEDRLIELRQQGSKRSGFPQNIGALVSAIAHDVTFREKPLGPIGDFVRLKEPVWSSILERSLGGALNGFVVTSKSDQMRLNSIMQKVRCKCPVYIGNHGTFSTQNHEPDDQFTTVLRVLQIDNDLIRRQLIINQAIEQTILIENPKEARTIMHRERLRNVKQCFSLNVNHAGCGIRYSYGQGTNLKSDPVDAFRGPPRMKTQTEDQISFEENQRQRLREALTDAENTRKRLINAVKRCQENITQHNKITMELKIEAQRVDQDADQLQDTVDNETVEEGRLDTLRSSLIQIEEEKAGFQLMYEDAVIERDKQDSRLAATKRRLDLMDGQSKKTKARQASAKELLAKTTGDCHQALLAKNRVFDEAKQLEDDKLKTEGQQKATSELVADWSTRAAVIGGRVPILPGETSINIEQKLLKLDEEVKLNEKRAGGDKRKLAEALRAATKRYEEALRQFQNERNLADLLRQSLETRRERWGHFRKKIVARARCTFLHVLSERSFNGKLKVDHKARKLEIEIQPDETQKSRQGRETTTLSGGEKSYSTICLLLSLWDAVGTPIRCLDEFDVFMDSVNRDISMKLIIKAARKSIGRQFILISPQAGIADRSRDVKIIKMRDPERNQTRLRV